MLEGLHDVSCTPTNMEVAAGSILYTGRATNGWRTQPGSSCPFAAERHEIMRIVMLNLLAWDCPYSWWKRSKEQN